MKHYQKISLVSYVRDFSHANKSYIKEIMY
jgi:hypothetical protein